ncbi:MAG: hypothetical protein SF053_13565 [Bacteroidia bacterium]|nr:hypothetical protein [Bacteroidia bacterium]
MTRRYLALCLVFTGLLSSPLYAERILEGLDFSRGTWSLIGVPLHNYKMLPIQEEMGCFITRDLSLLQQLQRDWNFEQTFEDKCDYHYALKFYQNGELVRTLNLNLYCGYISLDGLSYEFVPEEFGRFRTYAQVIPWSRINFADLTLLKRAVSILDRNQDVYWYEDIQPFMYPGYFMLSVDYLPWDANLDSIYAVTASRIRMETGRSDFYLKQYLYEIDGDYLSVRYRVNCDESLARNMEDAPYLKWRSHLHNRDSVSILAIGIDEDRYRVLMGQ